MWWVLAMMAHPEFQKRAQDQLDNVVGRSRTPAFADAPNLPYDMQALVPSSPAPTTSMCGCLSACRATELV